MSATSVEREALSTRWPGEWRDGARAAFQKYDGPRQAGGYPAGFNSWPLEGRNAWWSGYNSGRQDRIRAEAERLSG